ncbi:hypothetical protein HID58_092410 [Brassica napus]|uniref:Uncharacterized protein n=1 Tax=Brassica napus TaxID=3708 RepID=A0ABQ7WWM8_BRANA|nr:hypothetical protein HID58_092410 [Brassica napus]
MSEWEIVTFNVKYGGYWVKNLAGDVGYIGGEVVCGGVMKLNFWFVTEAWSFLNLGFGSFV